MSVQVLIKIKNIREILKLLPTIMAFGGGVISTAEKACRVFFNDGWPGVKRRILFVAARQHGTEQDDATTAVTLQGTSPEPVLLVPFDFSRRVSSGEQIAVMLHAFYPELVSEVREYIRNIRFPFDLFVSTDTVQKADFLSSAFSTVGARRVDIRVVPNRGRDIAAKLISFRDVYHAYSIVLHLHTKQSFHDRRLTAWRRFIFDCLVGSPAIVESVMDAFARLPKLGMIAPRTFAPVRPFMNWGVNFTTARALAQRMGITINLDSPLDFPAGSMFWARASALKPLLALDLSFEDFQEERGQTDGGLAHAIERLYFYACEKAGFRWMRAGHAADIRPPECLLRAKSPEDLLFYESSQAPALLMLGKRPRPIGFSLPTDADSEEMKNAFQTVCRQDLDAFLHRSGRFQMPTFENPEISVLLVLFNQAELTWHCLRSLEQSLDVSAEIIIVDNASTDRTSFLLDCLDGVRMQKHARNHHFLGGINAAAAASRGKYLLLLNNDIRVKAGSISAAFRRLEGDPSIGAVGGKIVSLDGRLQEAGSIIWQDGTCTGYGSGCDPAEAEFQFCREVDYCSGAFLMVRRDLFDRLGGLNAVYEPAYYEETDLCMRIRQAGFRVVYDPQVEVMHVQFGSMRSFEEALSLQQRNRRVFVRHHQSALEADHLPQSSGCLRARMRYRGKGRILVIDDRVPYPSLGSGYSRALQIMRTLVCDGWFVSYYPLIFPHVDFQEAYVWLPRETEILAGRGQRGLVDFLRERCGYYDGVLVSRPHNMECFNYACKDVSDFLQRTKLIYDAEAVFAVRDICRQKGFDESKWSPEDHKNIFKELALARPAHMVFAVNEKEGAMFRGAGYDNVRIVGNGVDLAPTQWGFFQREHFLFVGALDDDSSPNADSLIWFVQNIMPRLDQLMGRDYILNVVGRNGASNVRGLAGPRVRLLGRIENIRPFYESSRVFIAPTRFAAGIPTKIHEAAAMGLPVVATGLLCRQLGWNDGVELAVADTPEDFAAACARLYQDEKQWQQLRKAALARVAKDCSPSDFEHSVRSAVNECFGTR
ncbi:MAG TPA: rhamnan synthesis F family protein [Smithella sp.]|nr:rhamnan synthesis F family protein [Smithella sp.]